MKHLNYYQTKMDIRYFFVCKGIDILRENGLLIFIATNNWISNYGDHKMRNKIIKDSKIIKLIDFNMVSVFKKANIYTMIMVFQKNKNNEKYKFEYVKFTSKNINLKDIKQIIRDTKHVEIFYPEIIKHKHINKILSIL